MSNQKKYRLLVKCPFEGFQGWAKWMWLWALSEQVRDFINIQGMNLFYQAFSVGWERLIPLMYFCWVTSIVALTNVLGLDVVLVLPRTEGEKWKKSPSPFRYDVEQLWKIKKFKVKRGPRSKSKTWVYGGFQPCPLLWVGSLVVVLARFWNRARESINEMKLKQIHGWWRKRIKYFEDTINERIL